MFWKLIDSVYPERKTIVRINEITAMTTDKNNNHRLKIHLVDGKEFGADEDCLDNPELLDLEAMLKNNSELNIRGQ